MAMLARGYFRLLEWLLVACLAAMVVLVFGNVVLRYGFNSGLDISEELARLLFLISTFLGAIVAMRERLHLGVDSLVRRLSKRSQRACLLISLILMLCVTALLLQGSWAQARINLHTVLPVTGISMAVFYGVGVVFGISVGAMLLRDIWRVLAGRIDGDEMVVVHESGDLADIEAIEQALSRPTSAAATPNGARAIP